MPEDENEKFRRQIERAAEIKRQQDEARLAERAAQHAKDHRDGGKYNNG